MLRYGTADFFVHAFARQLLEIIIELLRGLKSKITVQQLLYMRRLGYNIKSCENKIK